MERDSELSRASAKASTWVYVGDRCRVCGEPMTRADMRRARWAGIGTRGTDVMHDRCWADGRVKPQAEWFDPVDRK